MKEEKTEHNKTQGEEIQVPCGTCAGSTYHKVLLSVDLSGSQEDENVDVSWNEHYQIIQCQGCKLISYRTASTNSEDYEPVGPDEWAYAVTQSYIPHGSKAGGPSVTKADIYLLTFSGFTKKRCRH